MLIKRLVSLDDYTLNSTKEWMRNYCKSIICPECHSIDRKIFPKKIDVIIDCEIPENSICNAMWLTGIRVFNKELFDQLWEYLPKDFVIGRCFDSKGELIRDYITCYSRNYIVIRGQKGSDYEICENCGTIHSPGLYPHYVPKYYLKDNLLYMDSRCHLYFHEKLLKKLDLSKWERFELDSIPIVKEPIDGVHLPIDPP